MSNFQKPANGWLCFFSILWIVVGVWLGVQSVIVGRYALTGLMIVLCLAWLTMVRWHCDRAPIQWQHNS